MGEGVSAAWVKLMDVLRQSKKKNVNIAENSLPIQEWVIIISFAN